MKEIKAVIKPFRLDAVLHALHAIEGLGSVTVSPAIGISVEHGSYAQVSMTKLEIMISDALLKPVLSAIEKQAHTGNPGDGRIYVIAVEQAIRIQTGESDV